MSAKKAINLEKALADLENMRQVDQDEGVANALFKVAVAQSVVTKRGWRRNIGIDYRYEDFEIVGYEAAPHIKAAVSV